MAAPRSRPARPDAPADQQTSPLMPLAARRVAQLRRVEAQGPTSYEILPSMDSPSAASGPDAATGAADGISAFVARVLDQLSLSAWLPAAFLTASLALLLQFRADMSASPLRAVRDLTGDPVRVLVLIVPTLVLATVVTQAFSFEAIRALERYWHRRGPASPLREQVLLKDRHGGLAGLRGGCDRVTDVIR
jgi:hypothetical protein